MQKVEIDYMMRGHILSDDIEDVDYVDVSEPQPEPKAKRSYDKTAREKEIADQATKHIKSLSMEPGAIMIELFSMSCFMRAAKWTDDNPLSSFGSNHDQYLALKSLLDKENDECCRDSGVHVDSMVHLLEMSISEVARRWANKNPPKYY